MRGGYNPVKGNLTLICQRPDCNKPFKPYHSDQKYCSKTCLGHMCRKRWIASHGGRQNIPSLVNVDRRPSKRYSSLKSTAKLRGLVVEITKEEHGVLISQPCHWCGGTLSHTGSGVDRRDNSLGYVRGNCLPCCTQCNNAKNDYPVDVFLTWIKQVYEKHGA